MRAYRHLPVRLLTVALLMLAATMPGISSAHAGKATHSITKSQVHQAKPSGPIRIEYWIVLDSDKNGLTTLMTGCFRMKGVLQDAGGDPAWTDTNYPDAQPAQLKGKCGTWIPLGGGILEPGAGGKLTSGYIYKTIMGKAGSIFVSFSGTVDKQNQATGKWLITGGTGAYEGIQGAGTASCDLSHFPYDRHIETGKIWWLSTT
jgi:hypothetical protein